MIALDFCIEMGKNQIVCVPIPTNESQWDKGSMYMVREVEESELPKKLTLNKLALIGEAEKSP